MVPDRLRAWTIVASLSSLPFILPHVVEDFTDGIAQRVGLSTGTGAFLLGGFLALQSLGLVLVGQRRRGGLLLTLGVGLVWVVVAVADHGPALLSGRFRAGLTSVVWVVGLILTQSASAALAWRGLRRARGPGGH